MEKEKAFLQARMHRTTPCGLWLRNRQSPRPAYFGTSSAYNALLEYDTQGNGLAEQQKQAAIEKQAKWFADEFSTSYALKGWIVEVCSINPVNTGKEASGADLRCWLYCGSHCFSYCEITITGSKNLEVASRLKSGDLIRFSGKPAGVAEPFAKQNLWSDFTVKIEADQIEAVKALTGFVIRVQPGAAGVDQRIVDEFMGHQTEAMRCRYRQLCPEQRRKAIEAVFGG